ncbi:monovalent cation/H+ antiporter subunit D family protein [Cocleimonas sp. KMM 6892]|uniref:monovalent cation/H+ antiporter subunit D family protein n=1 Tax=unclassified Cocleimonas TaxID=2639732 RepID=UPI002DBA7D57|nr:MULTISPECIES: monovalent cation/H+ antiporter subunit D family protein [unclassified Cocleimonas]MEB8434257.1 monovalent cation/H+ antiporter subunit D family protein [Cocleimonas sp. KMM 6892]MEC4717124.1 monovalent cation/H+ antiporter subunit D family protein [Cocleimonas sp. KMM 6895]MEC4746529.1 monovalent cation/H+ antiporter subunit D family protein [Cocleimonas sp. KMM 6896]
MINEHLPALQVVVPLLAAPICFLIPNKRLSWLFATLVSWLSFAMAILLVIAVNDGTILHYEFGGWAPPWGIEYKVDIFNSYVLLIVTAIGAAVFPYSWKSIQKEIPETHHRIYFTAMLLCLAGLLGMTITGDAFNLFVLLEISSLSSYTLISLGRDRRALTASFQYLIMGTIGATFILIGVGLLYALTGTLNMADLASRIPALEGSRTLEAAFAFLILGFGLKLAMFPLHLWLPNAYSYAPSSVSAFIGATATKVAIYALLRFLYTVFGSSFSFDYMQVHWLLMPLAIASFMFASIVAIFQDGIKRLLAYSSVAQIGYILLGISLVNVTGLTAALLHMFNHALMKGGLFLALGAIAYRIGSTRVQSIAGIGQAMPYTMAAFVIGSLSLIGVPLTVGFISKWYLILATLEKGYWPLTVLIIISSLLAVVYTWRVIETAYFQERPAGAPAVKEAPLSLLIPTWVVILANLYFGINSSLSTDLASDAALLLFGGSLL